MNNNHPPMTLIARRSPAGIISVLRLEEGQWLDLCRRTAVSIAAKEVGTSGHPLIWRFHEPVALSIAILDGEEQVFVGDFSSIEIRDQGCADPGRLPPADRKPEWPPPQCTPHLVTNSLAYHVRGEGICSPKDRVPPFYRKDIHWSFRGRRPNACFILPCAEKPILDHIPPEKGRELPPLSKEPKATPVPSQRIDELDAWWHKHGGGGNAAVDHAFQLARCRASQGRSWYNLVDEKGKPTGLWHAIEELEKGVGLFHGGEAWLEWTWLIYGPEGIIEPVRRSWTAGVRAEPGMLRASGHRAFRHPPPFHPDLLIADDAVYGQTIPDPDRIGMVLRT